MELFIKKISRNTRSRSEKTQTFENSGRILNRVSEWGRDCITIEVDQWHVREILEDLGLERANHFATPCAVERKNQGNAGSDESEGQN